MLFAEQVHEKIASGSLAALAARFD